MSRLEIALLGLPRIEVDGRRVEVDTRKATALLAYLAVTARPQARDHLAALLWPEYDDTHARGALRRTLSTLKSALGGEWLETRRSELTLGTVDVASDVGRFRALLDVWRAHGHDQADACQRCLAPLAEAVELHRGDFMSGFALRDSPEFDDWQFSQAEQLRRDLATALDRLSRAEATTGELAAAIEHAGRRLALDPLHEPAHVRLMELHAWHGDRSGAMRQYRDCVRILDQELGVAPLADTTELYRAISEDRFAVPTTTATPPPELPESPERSRRRYPLVGRELELDALIAAYEQTGPDGRLILIEGEAGIGKTRLAEELLGVARARGATGLYVRCHEGEQTLAYAPFVDAVRNALLHDTARAAIADAPAHWLAAALPLVPELEELRPGLAALDGPGAQGRLFEGVARVLLAALAGPSPGLLVIDELRWADEASLGLAAYLARRLEGRPYCLVFCHRSDEIAAPERIAGLVADQQLNGSATVVRPRRLSAADIGLLVATVDVPDRDGLTERLHREAEGVPLFVVEYLAALGSPSWPVLALPGGVRSLLQSRLAALGETARQVLTAAAVIGRSFDPDLVREVSGRGEEETVAALEELSRRGMIAEPDAPGDGRYDFSHDRLRELVDAETSLARRRLLHRRVAQALLARSRGAPAPAGSAALIADHFRRAGDDRAAADFHLQAGDANRRVHANADALAQYGAALALGHPDAARLHEAIGDLETLQGRYDAALASYEAAAARCDADQISGVEHKLGALHHRRGEWVLAERHLEAALASLPGGREERRARILADRSLTAHRSGDRRRAEQSSQESLVAAEQAGDREALARAHNMLGILAGSRRRRKQAREHLELSLALARALPEPTGRVAALNNLALLDRADGQIERALEHTREALVACTAQGDRHREAALRNNLADLLHSVGRRDEAMAELTQAVTIFAEVGEPGTLQPEIWKLVEW